MIHKKINMASALIAVFAAAVFLSGCICPLFSFFEKMTGLEIKAGENINEDIVNDELIYPGSAALVQVSGEMEKVLGIIAEYGVSFSEEERQLLDDLPDSVKSKEVGAILYSTADGPYKVISYYEELTEKGWQIQSFNAPVSGISESNIILAVKDQRRQALMVSGSESNSFIIFIDFDWELLKEK